MKALLLDGSREQDGGLAPAKRMLLEELRAAGHEVQDLVLRDLRIAPCVGCFGCWIKTPGVCVIPDTGRDVARAIIGSDLAIFFTPVTFGGYSSELKKALDRSICLLLPFFTSIGGETHHPLRYSRYPDLIAVGVQPREDAESEAAFTALLHKNAVNMHSPSAQVLLIRSGGPLDDARTRVRSALEALGVKR